MDREATARAYYEALDAGDYDRLADLLTEDVHQQRPDRRFDGREQFVRFMREERPRTDTTHPVDAVYTDGAEVAVRGRLVGGGGEQIAAFVDVFAFESGRIASITTYTR